MFFNEPSSGQEIMISSYVLSPIDFKWNTKQVGIYIYGEKCDRLINR